MNEEVWNAFRELYDASASSMEILQFFAVKSSNSQRDKSEVHERKLTDKERVLFDAAKGEEIHKILKNRAVWFLNAEETARVLEELGDRLIGSRYVLTWKTNEETCQKEARAWHAGAFAGTRTRIL